MHDRNRTRDGETAKRGGSLEDIEEMNGNGRRVKLRRDNYLLIALYLARSGRFLKNADVRRTSVRSRAGGRSNFPSVNGREWAGSLDSWSSGLGK